MVGTEENDMVIRVAFDGDLTADDLIIYNISLLCREAGEFNSCFCNF